MRVGEGSVNRESIPARTSSQRGPILAHPGSAARRPCGRRSRPGLGTPTGARVRPGRPQPARRPALRARKGGWAWGLLSWPLTPCARALRRPQTCERLTSDGARGGTAGRLGHALHLVHGRGLGSSGLADERLGLLSGRGGGRCRPLAAEEGEAAAARLRQGGERAAADAVRGWVQEQARLWRLEVAVVTQAVAGQRLQGQRAANQVRLSGRPHLGAGGRQCWRREAIQEAPHRGGRWEDGGLVAVLLYWWTCRPWRGRLGNRGDRGDVLKTGGGRARSQRRLVGHLHLELI